MVVKAENVQEFEVKDVSFTYPNEAGAARCDAFAKERKTTAIVGLSGAEEYDDKPAEQVLQAGRG